MIPIMVTSVSGNMVTRGRSWGVLAVATSLLLLLVVGGMSLVALAVLLCSPVAIFFGWVSSHAETYSITAQEHKQIFYCFLAGIFPSTMLAGLIQTAMLPFWLLLCFADQWTSLSTQLHALLDENNGATSGSGMGSLHGSPVSNSIGDLLAQLDVRQTFGYFVFLFALSFTVAALVEESLKLWIVQGSCCACATCGGGRGICNPRHLLYQQERHRHHWMVIYIAVVAGALGFSFAENIGYTFASPTASDKLLTAVLRGFVSTPLHCVCGAMTGGRLALRMATISASSRQKGAATAMAPRGGGWRANLSMLYPAIVSHGTFDFQAFLLASLISQEQADHYPVMLEILLPGACALAVLVASVVYVVRSFRRLQETMERGVYVQVEADLESGDLGNDSDDEVSSVERSVLHV